jgi:DNA-directed RNA polymerase beta' subunit
MCITCDVISPGPQTEEARAEALELMGVVNNLCTPKDGTPIISATQVYLCIYVSIYLDR